MEYLWTMKNGETINVDDMDENHLRNALKMLLKGIEAAKNKPKEIRSNFTESVEDALLDEEYEDYMEAYHEDWKWK